MDEESPVCIHCRGTRILPGRFTGNPELPTAGFFRWGLRKPILGRILDSLSGAHKTIRCPKDAFHCLDCGTTWTTIDPDIAIGNLKEWADAETLSRLGLSDKPAMMRDLD